MFSFRQIAFRALASTSPSATVLRSSRSLHIASSGRPVARVLSLNKPSAFLQFRRTFADETEKKDLEDERIEDVPTSAIDAAKDTASSIASDVASGAQKAAGIASGVVFGSAQKDNVYIGNLYFEITEDQLKEDFSAYGEVTESKVIRDMRGLSKGFGYIKYTTEEAAANAIDRANNSIYQGRRITVQPAVKKSPSIVRNNSPTGYSNSPTKTLFIGNMSYDMTDKDLNDLFRGVSGVKDVRVAIDRRTGQPRGFCHADFISVETAEKAAEFLKSQQFYGRQLKVDFSASSRPPPNPLPQPSSDPSS